VAALSAPLALAAPSDHHRSDAVADEAPGGGAVTDTFAHQAVEDAVGRERARIARELHDGIATELAGAISLFKVYLERQNGNPDETLSNVFHILERSLRNVRESLAELRPAAIGPDGLVVDLRHQAKEFAQMYGIRVEISSNGSEDMISGQQREVVAQVVHEALTNVRRHSGSSICRVKMGFAARPFLIEVSDEGRGFVAGGASGYGLMGMRERAAGIGGRLEVVSTEGRGTTVFLFGPN
jgi:signal transduction histidine kinase